MAGAARQLAAERGGATWREMAHRAQVGFDQARQTAWAMVRYDELVIVGYRRVAGTNRPAAVFSPASAAEHAQSDQLLADVVSAWHRAPPQG